MPPAILVDKSSKVSSSWESVPDAHAPQIGWIMPHSAHDIAAELRKRLPDVPTKKLHKLLYYCQAHHLAVFDSPMFSETVSAWAMGPVVGQLWWEENNGQVHEAGLVGDEAVLNTVGYVVSRCGALSGKDLEHLTHEEAPWLQANEHREPGAPNRSTERRCGITSATRIRTRTTPKPSTPAQTQSPGCLTRRSGSDSRESSDSVARLRARLTNA